MNKIVIGIAASAIISTASFAFMDAFKGLSQAAQVYQQNAATINQAQNVINAATAMQQQNTGLTAEQQALLQQAAQLQQQQAQQLQASGYSFIKGKSGKADIVARFGNPTNVMQAGDLETWTYSNTQQNASGESAQATANVAKGLLSLASSFLPTGGQNAQIAQMANSVANNVANQAVASAASASAYKSAVFIFSKNGILSDYSIVK